MQRKKIARLDDGCRAVIESAPLVLVATSRPDGGCEVSPRGGPPGFVQVLDEQRLAIPDLSGNNLVDSISNIVLNPHVGLLFVLPGRDETLRVNGRAWLTTDDAVLDGFTAELRRPKAAIGVEVVDAFVHCAKSFRRGQVWDPASWAPDVAPSAAELLDVPHRARHDARAAGGQPREGLRPRPRRRAGRREQLTEVVGAGARRQSVPADEDAPWDTTRCMRCSVCSMPARRSARRSLRAKRVPMMNQPTGVSGLVIS